MGRRAGGTGRQRTIPRPPDVTAPVPERHHREGGVGLAEQIDEPLDPLDEDVAAGR
jgi:hypothetical protein